MEQLVIRHKRKEAVTGLVTSKAQEPIQEVARAELLNGSAHGVIRCSIRKAVKDQVLRKGGTKNEEDGQG